MQPESPLLRRFIAHLRLVSLALFTFAALCLLGVLMLERTFETNRDALLWLKMLEEVPKGVLAASAVAFLYDWLLKLENADQMREAVSDVFNAVKLELLDDIKFDLEAMALGDVEMMGEFLDTLKSFGLADDHPLVSKGVEFILAEQNPDGSWGDVEARDVYQRYHPTFTAINGLRDYRR
jgi:hypothetical protein